jgi:hypothetical protein
MHFARQKSEQAAGNLRDELVLRMMFGLSSGAAETVAAGRAEGFGAAGTSGVALRLAHAAE